MTKQEKVCEYLEKKGLKEIPSKSRKYRTFQGEKAGFYFVGRSGALRVGQTISGSVSISNYIKIN